MSLSLEHLPALLRVTHEVLSRRILVFVALAMTFGLFCWAMAAATVLSVCVAGTFAAMVFLPILLRKESSDEQAA
jgi:hypothetical protein